MSQPPEPPDESQHPHYPQHPGQPQYPQYPQESPDPWYAQDPAQPGAPRHPGEQPYAGPRRAQAGFSAPQVRGTFGPRLAGRPEPRFSVSLAGAGVVLVILGVLVWSVSYLVDGLDVTFGPGGAHTTGDGRRVLGIVLSLLAVAGGYALVILRRRGPLATAGVLASAIGVPVLILFLSLDLGATLTGGSPFSVDAVYLVSIIVWAASYVFVPGARGHAFYLALALGGLVSYLDLKAGDGGGTAAALATVDPGGSSGGLSPTSLLSAAGGGGGAAALALVFGLGYYVIALLLDRSGRAGMAVAFVVAGFGSVVGGVVQAAPDLHQAGTGIFLVVLGIVLSFYGAWSGRRFTSWAWAAGFVLGVALLVAKVLPDSGAGAGIVFIVVGAVVVAAAALYHSMAGEPPEYAETPLGGGGSPSAPALPGPWAPGS